MKGTLSPRIEKNAEQQKTQLRHEKVLERAEALFLSNNDSRDQCLVNLLNMDLKPEDCNLTLPMDEHNGESVLYVLMENVFLSKNQTDMEKVSSVITQSNLDWNHTPKAGHHTGNSPLWFLMVLVANKNDAAMNILPEVIAQPNLDWNQAPQKGFDAGKSSFWVLVAAVYRGNQAAMNILPNVITHFHLDWNQTAKEAPEAGKSAFWLLMAAVFNKNHAAIKILPDVIKHGDLNWNQAPQDGPHANQSSLWILIKAVFDNNQAAMDILPYVIAQPNLDWNQAPKTDLDDTGKSPLWFLLLAVFNENQIAMNILSKVIAQSDLDWNQAPQEGPDIDKSSFWILMAAVVNRNPAAMDILPKVIAELNLDWNQAAKEGPHADKSSLWFLMVAFSNGNHAAIDILPKVITQPHLDWHQGPPERSALLILIESIGKHPQNNAISNALEKLLVARILTELDFNPEIHFFNNPKMQEAFAQISEKDQAKIKLWFTLNYAKHLFLEAQKNNPKDFSDLIKHLENVKGYAKSIKSKYSDTAPHMMNIYLEIQDLNNALRWAQEIQAFNAITILIVQNFIKQTHAMAALGIRDNLTTHLDAIKKIITKIPPDNPQYNETYFMFIELQCEAAGKHIKKDQGVDKETRKTHNRARRKKLLSIFDNIISLSSKLQHSKESNTHTSSSLTDLEQLNVLRKTVAISFVYGSTNDISAQNLASTNPILCGIASPFPQDNHNALKELRELHKLNKRAACNPS